MKQWHRGFGLALAVLALPATGTAQIALLSRSVEERQVSPGESYSGTLVVKNTTAQAQEAKVYQTDYQFHADGRTLYGEPGTTARSNAPWISLSSARVMVPPGGEATVSYRVVVPAGGSLGGTYWSLIMIEGIPASSAESSRKRGGSVRPEYGIQSRLRYAVQIATHIAGTGTHRVEFVGAKVVRRPPDGALVLEFDVLNTSDLALRPEVAADVYDQHGKLVGSFKQQRGLLYPGASLRQQFELRALSPGTYQALVLVDTGGPAVFGAQYTVTF